MRRGEAAARRPARVRVAALFSGGKDSTLAAWVAENHGWEVTHLVTVRPRATDSWMFHVPNLHVTPLQAEAWGKPLVTVETAGERENELAELTHALARLKEESAIEGIVSGAVASEYQRTRLERVGHATGLRTFTPLWHKPPRAILHAVTRPGWDVRFAAVAAEGLGAKWLGRALDAASLAELEALRARHGVHPGGEGGEYESLVLATPFWPRRVRVAEATPAWERDRGTWEVARAEVAPRA